MSKYATSSDLYKAKAEYYEEKASRLEAERNRALCILESCLEFVDSGVPGYDEWKAEFDSI
jgi:hypothetical protein